MTRRHSHTASPLSALWGLSDGPALISPSLFPRLAARSESQIRVRPSFVVFHCSGCLAPTLNTRQRACSARVGDPEMSHVMWQKQMFQIHFNAHMRFLCTIPPDHPPVTVQYRRCVTSHPVTPGYTCRHVVFLQTNAGTAKLDAPNFTIDIRVA